MEYGCIGEKLAHSFSKEIHNAIGEYEYELKEVSRDSFDEFMKLKNFKAINVTIPYKEMVIPYLDEIDDKAKQIGAVNTIVNRSGKLYGYNTDFYGMEALIKKMDYSLKGKKVAVLGTGGTSKTAKAVAESQGAREIRFVSRTKREGVITYGELKESYTDVEVIINTTPCGMYPYILEEPLSLADFENLEAVVDVIYNPLRTGLILNAGFRGCKAEGGLYMLVAQAVRASEIFLDCRYESDKLDRIFQKLRSKKENIVLIGMPGSGKSTVGRLIAEKLHRNCIDTDECIEEKSKCSVSDIFRKQGEAFFRGLEKKVVYRLASETGIVIATGGGVPLLEENRLALQKNGRIYYINRPLEDLIPTEDRPLSSTREALEKRFQERYLLYQSMADISITNISTAEDAAEKIIGDFLK